MREIADLDRRREALLARCIDLDNEAADLAKQRDSAFRRMSDPRRRQEYERLTARSEEIAREREQLSRQMEELDRLRAAKMGAIRNSESDYHREQ
jgi:hypothetical protein